MKKPVCAVVLAAAVIFAEEPTPSALYKASEAVSSELDKVGQVSRVGATSTLVNNQHYHAVVRRRSASGTPQNAIVHPRSSEVYEIIDGSGTLVTGGVLDPAPGVAGTVQAQNNVTSTGIKGGRAQQVSKGDLVFVPAGSAHWFSKIDGQITYLEVQFETN